MDLTPPPAGTAQMSEAGVDASAASQAADAVPEVEPDEVKPETPPDEVRELPEEVQEPPVEDEPIELAEEDTALPELTSEDVPPLEEQVTAETPPDQAQTIDEVPPDREIPPEVATVPPDVEPAVALPPERAVVAREETPAPRPVKRTEPRVAEPRKVAPARAERRVAERPRAQPPSPSSAARQGGSSGIASDPGAARAVAAAYGRKLNALIAAQKRYPAAAERQRLSGRAIVAFTVSRSGAVIAQSIASSSGHAILDQELMAMLRRAAPSFPALPPEIPGASKRFTLPMTFTAPR
jgi:protein TonB